MNLSGSCQRLVWKKHPYEGNACDYYECLRFCLLAREKEAMNLTPSSWLIIQVSMVALNPGHSYSKVNRSIFLLRF